MPATDLPELEGVEHRYVDVRGARLHVAEIGSGPPVMLVHGWPQHWWTWRSLMPLLAGDFRVMALDLRGFGWSEATPRGYRKDELAEDMLALLDALELERVDLIGHDWGAFAGFLLCVRAPERIGHFLSCSIPHLWPHGERPSPKAFMRLWYQVALATPGLGEGLMRQGEFTRRTLQVARTHGRYSDEELATFVDVLREPAHARAASRYYRTFLFQELRPLIDGAFHERPLTTPTRLLWGRHDPILQGARADQHPSFAPALETEWVENTGHFLPEERPELVVARARELFGA